MTGRIGRLGRDGRAVRAGGFGRPHPRAREFKHKFVIAERARMGLEMEACLILKTILGRLGAGSIKHLLKTIDFN